MSTQPDVTPRVYYATRTPVYLENSDPLTIGQRVTLTGDPRGSAVAAIETGALVLADDSEQLKATKATSKTTPTSTDKAA